MSSRAKTAIKPIYVDLPTVSTMVALSEDTVQRLVRMSDFPAPRMISNRRVGWLVREVEEWAEGRPVSDFLPPENTARVKHGT
jgi:prophage regulatory protein